MEDIKLEDIIEILEDVEEGIDYEHVTDLVDGKHLDSFDIIAIINAISDEYDISIPAKDIVPENFNSAQAICNLVKRLVDED
ncbi:MAG: acyl carrier protein [Eggerthellaceae bacterium]|nr:acyl carrier protein [Eggerthellaceae bacterium]